MSVKENKEIRCLLFRSKGSRHSFFLFTSLILTLSIMAGCSSCSTWKRDVVVTTADPFFRQHDGQSWKHEKATINLVSDFINSLPGE